MRFAVDISPAGRWGAPVLQAELAALAEDSGWDGVFCEDYLAFADRLDTLRCLDNARSDGLSDRTCDAGLDRHPTGLATTMDGRGSGDHS